MPDRKPEAVTGEAVFTSYDGLRIEANGAIGFLTFENGPLELRSDKIMAALPPSSKFESAIFLQAINLEDSRQWIVGLVQQIKDFNKRPGTLGACVSISDDNRNLTGVGAFLYDVLFPIVEDAMSEHWMGKPLPERLNLIHGAPSRETHVPYKMKAATELLHQVASEEANLQEIIEAGIKLIEISPNIGRIVISPTPTKATRPANTEFISSVNSAYEDAQRRSELRRQRAVTEQRSTRSTDRSPESVEGAVRALLAQEVQIEEIENRSRSARRISKTSHSEPAQPPKSMDEVLRRQEIIGQRLTRLERYLSSNNGQRVKSTMPIDRAFGSANQKSDRLNSIVLMGGVGLAIILILLLVVWLLFRSDGTEVENVNLEAISSAPEEPAGEDTLQSIPDDVIVDCANPKTLAEQTRCEETQE